MEAQPESNRCPRICNPLHNHSANAPAWRRGYYNPEACVTRTYHTTKSPRPRRAFSVGQYGFTESTEVCPILHTTTVPLDLCWITEIKQCFDVRWRLSAPHTITVHHQCFRLTKLPQTIERRCAELAFHDFTDRQRSAPLAVFSLVQGMLTAPGIWPRSTQFGVRESMTMIESSPPVICSR